MAQRGQPPQNIRGRGQHGPRQRGRGRGRGELPARGRGNGNARGRGDGRAQNEPRVVPNLDFRRRAAGWMVPVPENDTKTASALEAAGIPFRKEHNVAHTNAHGFNAAVREIMTVEALKLIHHEPLFNGRMLTNIEDRFGSDRTPTIVDYLNGNADEGLAMRDPRVNPLQVVVTGVNLVTQDVFRRARGVPLGAAGYRDGRPTDVILLVNVYVDEAGPLTANRFGQLFQEQPELACIYCVLHQFSGAAGVHGQSAYVRYTDPVQGQMVLFSPDAVSPNYPPHDPLDWLTLQDGIDQEANVQWSVHAPFHGMVIVRVGRGVALPGNVARTDPLRWVHTDLPDLTHWPTWCWSRILPEFAEPYVASLPGVRTQRILVDQAVVAAVEGLVSHRTQTPYILRQLDVVTQNVASQSPWNTLLKRFPYQIGSMIRASALYALTQHVVQHGARLEAVDQVYGEDIARYNQVLASFGKSRQATPWWQKALWGVGTLAACYCAWKIFTKTTIGLSWESNKGPGVKFTLGGGLALSDHLHSGLIKASEWLNILGMTWPVTSAVLALGGGILLGRMFPRAAQFTLGVGAGWALWRLWQCSSWESSPEGYSLRLGFGENLAERRVWTDVVIGAALALVAFVWWKPSAFQAKWWPAFKSMYYNGAEDSSPAVDRWCHVMVEEIDPEDGVVDKTARPGNKAKPPQALLKEFPESPYFRRQGLSITCTPDPIPACEKRPATKVYFLAAFSAPQHSPAKTDENLYSLVEYRLARALPLGEEHRGLQYAAWNSATMSMLRRKIERALYERLVLLGKDTPLIRSSKLIQQWFLHMKTTMQYRRATAAMEALGSSALSADQVHTVPIICKTDESLMKREAGFSASEPVAADGFNALCMIARPIGNIGPKQQATVGPEVYEAQLRLAAAWSWDWWRRSPDLQVEHPRDHALKLPLWFVYSCSINTDELAAIVSQFITWPTSCAIVCALGDDSKVLVKLDNNEMRRWIIYESDFSMFDISETDGPLEADLETLVTLGVSKPTLQCLSAEDRATLRLQGNGWEVRINKEHLPSRVTGSARTSIGNTTVTVKASARVICELFWSDLLPEANVGAKIEAEYLQLGFKAKVKVSTATTASDGPVEDPIRLIAGHTFLKMIFVPVHPSEHRNGWLVYPIPLPGRTLKFGKILKDPREITRIPGERKLSYKKAAKRFLRSFVESQKGYRFDPISTAVLEKWAAINATLVQLPFEMTRQAISSPSVPGAAALWSFDDGTFDHEDDVGWQPPRLDSQGLDSVLIKRYGFSLSDFKAVAELIRRCPSPFFFASHPIFETMACIDYG